MRPYFIVNPVAGGGKAKESFTELAAYLDSRNAEYASVFTESAGQSAPLAEQAYAAGERFICAVGGDGTINEVASVLYSKRDVVFGICPFGTGNDFARVLKLPTDPEGAGRVLLDGIAEPVDIGMAGDRPFTNIAGIGFDVGVVINTERYKARFHGMIPYLLGVARTLMHMKAIPMKITADGKTIEENALLLSIGNGSHFGGGMAALPNANAQDGLFEICLVKKINIFRFLTLLPLFIKGKHIGKKPVVCLRAKEVTVECPDTPSQLDGEMVEHAASHYRLIPGALCVMLPPKVSE